jgi:D-alanine transaminase
MDQPTVFWCGQYLPRDQAKMDVEDRGVLFGDGIYEVLRYYRGLPLAMGQHIARLRGSLEMIQLPATADVERIDAISDEVVRRNGLADAKVYWQVTRGNAGPRNHVIPAQVQPTLLVMASPAAPLEQLGSLQAIKAVLAPDIRWGMCCAKTLMLLPAVLAVTQARRQGADEAILHREGTVTEGAATNVLIVRRGELWTHPANHLILKGVTLALVLEQARALGIPVVERPFSVQELLSADEVMVTGTTTHIRAVTHVDGKPIAGGNPGPVTTRLLGALIRSIESACRR